jgi:hypothetical protein
VGASACQIATTHWKEGPSAFTRIISELRQLMTEQGFTSIQRDVIHQLQPWSKQGATLAREYNQKQKAKGALEKGASGTDSGSQSLLVFQTLCAILVAIIAVLLMNQR